MLLNPLIAAVGIRILVGMIKKGPVNPVVEAVVMMIVVATVTLTMPAGVVMIIDRRILEGIRKMRSGMKDVTETVLQVDAVKTEMWKLTRTGVRVMEEMIRRTKEVAGIREVVILLVEKEALENLEAVVVGVDPAKILW